MTTFAEDSSLRSTYGDDDAGPNLPAPRRSWRALYTKCMIVVRRVHMYAGLLLLPWVLLYGLSGMLFNHPEWCGPVEVLDQFTADEVDDAVGFAPLDAPALAAEVVAKLNAQSRDAVALVPDSPVINDGLLFAGPTDRGRTLVALSPNDGTANVRYFFEAPQQDQPPFHNAKVAVDGYDSAQLAERSATLMKHAGADPMGPVRPVDGSGNIRFLVESKADGRRWNVIYNLPTGGVTARAADADSSVDFYTLVTRLHMRHHYPDRVNGAWFWALAADVTGITMMTWALTGLIMWWQVKRTRVLGVMAVSVGLMAGGAVFFTTDGELRFGPARRPGPAIGTARP